MILSKKTKAKRRNLRKEGYVRFNPTFKLKNYPEVGCFFGLPHSDHHADPKVPIDTIEVQYERSGKVRKCEFWIPQIYAELVTTLLSLKIKDNQLAFILERMKYDEAYKARIEERHEQWLSLESDKLSTQRRFARLFEVNNVKQLSAPELPLANLLELNKHKVFWQDDGTAFCCCKGENGSKQFSSYSSEDEAKIRFGVKQLQPCHELAL